MMYIWSLRILIRSLVLLLVPFGMLYPAETYNRELFGIQDSDVEELGDTVIHQLQHSIGMRKDELFELEEVVVNGINKTKASNPEKEPRQESNFLRAGSYQGADYSDETHPETDFDADDDKRTYVQNASEWPYRVHGQVVAYFKDTRSGREDHGHKPGSGTLIGPCHVLTAGHNIYDPTIGGWPYSVEFIPAMDGNEAPYGAAYGRMLLTTEKWKDSQEIKHDYAVIVLDSRLGEKLGWFGIGFAPDSSIRQIDLTIAGYPKDKKELSQQWQMWQMTKKPALVLPEQLKYRISTYSGTSGSGVWGSVNNDYTVFGVHAYGEREHNCATRITEKKFKRLIEWIKKINPKTEPFLQAIDRLINNEGDAVTLSLLKNQQYRLVDALKKNTSLRELDLGESDLTIDSQLKEALQEHPALLSVGLAKVGLTDLMLRQLSYTLSSMPKLKALNLSNNFVTKPGALTTLLAILERNTSLSTLTLEGNPIWKSGEAKSKLGKKVASQKQSYEESVARRKKLAEPLVKLFQNDAKDYVTEFLVDYLEDQIKEETLGDGKKLLATVAKQERVEMMKLMPTLFQGLASAERNVLLSTIDRILPKDIRIEVLRLAMKGIETYKERFTEKLGKTSYSYSTFRVESSPCEKQPCDVYKKCFILLCSDTLCLDELQETIVPLLMYSEVTNNHLLNALACLPSKEPLVNVVLLIGLWRNSTSEDERSRFVETLQKLRNQDRISDVFKALLKGGVCTIPHQSSGIFEHLFTFDLILLVCEVAQYVPIEVFQKVLKFLVVSENNGDYSTAKLRLQSLRLFPYNQWGTLIEPLSEFCLALTPFKKGAQCSLSHVADNIETGCFNCSDIFLHTLLTITLAEPDEQQELLSMSAKLCKLNAAYILRNRVYDKAASTAVSRPQLADLEMNDLSTGQHQNNDSCFLPTLYLLKTCCLLCRQEPALLEEQDAISMIEHVYSTFSDCKEMFEVLENLDPSAAIRALLNTGTLASNMPLFSHESKTLGMPSCGSPLLGAYSSSKFAQLQTVQKIAALIPLIPHTNDISDFLLTFEAFENNEQLVPVLDILHSLKDKQKYHSALLSAYFLRSMLLAVPEERTNKLAKKVNTLFDILDSQQKEELLSYLEAKRLPNLPQILEKLCNNLPEKYLGGNVKFVKIMQVLKEEVAQVYQTT